MNAYESPIHELSLAYAVLLVSILKVFFEIGRMTITVWELALGRVPVSIFQEQ